jgi:hypothetical protein
LPEAGFRVYGRPRVGHRNSHLIAAGGVYDEDEP